MSVLFISGNTNQYTFGNAVAAAHVIDIRGGNKGLTDIFVLNSPESEYSLNKNGEWRDYLIDLGIEVEIISPFTIDFSKGASALAHAARHFERCIASVDHRDDVYVDLTNGASLSKGVLSNIAYLLGVRHTYVLDLMRVYSDQGISRPTKPEFLTDRQLLSAYIEFPDPSQLDEIAPEWLTEVRRFNRKAHAVSQQLRSMAGVTETERKSFESDVSNAIHTWFKGQRLGDGAALGGSVRHIGRAFEELARCVLTAMLQKPPKKNLKLHEMLQKISSILQVKASNYEPKLVEDISQLLRSLRNESTHEHTSPEFGRIRARLSTELLFSTAEYFQILDSQGLLQAADFSQVENQKASTISGRDGERYFFGIDGDDTGAQLENLFQRAAMGEEFSRFSVQISDAMQEISQLAILTPMNATVHFCTGDDLLFEAHYDGDQLREMQTIYERCTGGSTCSIGFGRTAREAYVAIKMAKASPGKGRIVGIELIGSTEATTKD